MARTSPAPPVDPHDHEVPLVDVRPPWRWRAAVGLLAVLVALALGLLTWRIGILPGRGRTGPAGPAGRSASPSSSASPRPHPTPHLTPTPAVVILPPATRSTSSRPRSTSTRSSRPSATHRPSSHPSSASPGPTPIVCVTAGPASACLHRPSPLIVRPWTLRLII